MQGPAGTHLQAIDLRNGLDLADHLGNGGGDLRLAGGDLLQQAGLKVAQTWVNDAGEEGVFLCQRG